MEYEKEIDFYRANGFLMVNNLIEGNLIDDMFISLNQILKKYHKDTKDYKGWNDLEFHKIMIDIKKNDPKKFSAIYDTMQVSLALFSINTQKEIAYIVSKLLNTTVYELATTGFMLRMDVPFDNKNKLDWHQDNAYYKQNLDGDNGLVVWIPMHKVDTNIGTVKALKESHKFGLITSKHIAKSSYTTSEQFIIPDEYINLNKEVDIVANNRDISFFHMDLIHRSGDNISEKIRFVAGVRYHKMSANDFSPGRLSYVHSKIGREN